MVDVSLVAAVVAGVAEDATVTGDGSAKPAD
jgi:hypothetical protein